jgi:hypothetical protein
MFFFLKQIVIPTQNTCAASSAKNTCIVLQENRPFLAEKLFQIGQNSEHKLFTLT